MNHISSSDVYFRYLLQDNYERELALHSAACSDARNIRSQLETFMDKCHSLERENDNLKTVQLSAIEKNAGENSELQVMVATLERQVQEARNLNGLLHNQLSSVTKALAQLESDRESKAGTVTGVQENSTEEEKNTSYQHINELQEIIAFMRSEREMLESQLNHARRTAEREKSAADVAKRALEAARVELDISVTRQLRDENSEPIADLTAKVKAYDDQIKLLRESNQLLRDEVDKLSAQLLNAQNDKSIALNALEPMQKERQSLEIQKATLEVEKNSLIREVDAWKERVQSLVTKFHQVKLLNLTQ